jgi:hypothetical protein
MVLDTKGDNMEFTSINEAVSIFFRNKSALLAVTKRNNHGKL